MNDAFFEESDFLFLCRCTLEKLEDFVCRFALRLNPHSNALSLLSLPRASQGEQTSWLKHLEVSRQIGVDLYLLDPLDRHFMICLRPDDHVVFGIPYCLLNEGDTLALLRHFNAIYGWGWSGEPPPQNITDIRKQAQSPSPIYRRYYRGTMIPADS